MDARLVSLEKTPRGKVSSLLSYRESSSRERWCRNASGCRQLRLFLFSRLNTYNYWFCQKMFDVAICI